MRDNHTTDVENFPADKRVAIVASQYHSDITDALVEHCLAVLRESGARPDQLTVVRVPGSWEVPLAVQRLAQEKIYGAIVAFGAVIEGETDHYRLIVDNVARALMDIGLRYDVPVVFEILGADEKSKLLARAAGDEMDKGREAGETALGMLSEMPNLKSKIYRKSLKD